MKRAVRAAGVRAAGVRAAGALAVIGVLAACGSPSPAAPAPARTGQSGTAAHRTGRAGDRGAMARGATAAAVRPRVTVARVRSPDGSEITLATFRGPVRYVLHNGSQDPGPAAASLVSSGPVIGETERGLLLAAFNGGFKLSGRAGGYEQEGHVISRLRRGLASLVIDRSGRAQIGVWGAGVPAPGETVYSVRQNLWPLLSGGQPTAESARWWRWGGTIGHAEYVARSALGQNGAGDLIYAASMSATPADLAGALARSGARIAMELDINPEWVQLDYARRPGGPLIAAVPGQHRPADQYLTGWTRDFITVLAPHAEGSPPG